MKRRLLLGSSLASLLASLAAAIAADAFLTVRIPIAGSFAGLLHSLNAGIAWGVHLPPVVQPVLILIALIFVGWYALRFAGSAYGQLGFGLVLGGGVANVIDRIRDGVVTDYFQVGSFPIFNVADSCITIGITLFFIETVLQERKRKAERDDK